MSKSRVLDSIITAAISIFKGYVPHVFWDMCGLICTGNLWKITQETVNNAYLSVGLGLEGRLPHFEFSLLHAFITFKVQKLVF